MGRELGGLVAARLRAEEHRAESSGPRRSLPLQARDDASSSGELCFLWYRSGELDKRLAASSDGAPIATRHVNRQAQGKSEGWRLLPSAQAGSSLHSKENGKYAFVLESAHNATPLGAATATAALEFRFNVTSPRSSLVIAHMLDKEIYGAAQAELDGAPFGPLLYGSSPGFSYHLLTTQRLGTVEGVGEHRLALRLVRAAPTARSGFGSAGSSSSPRRAAAAGTRPSTAGRCRMIEGTKSRRRRSRGSSLMDFGPEFLDSLHRSLGWGYGTQVQHTRAFTAGPV